MQRALLLTVCLTCVALDVRSVATHTGAGPAQIIERSSNHRVWQNIVTNTAPNGRLFVKTNNYTELATGLCYRNKQGEWVDADPQIVVQADGTGVGQAAGHSVRFLPDISSDGGITSSASDKQLHSHVLGICYYDWKNQREAQIAGTKSSIGKIVAKNQLIYADAFDGLKADVRYDFKKAGLGQDVIFREQLPSPADLKMDPATTRVEVWTEFVKPPEAKLKGAHKNRSGEEFHNYIDFGNVRIGKGSAFAVPNQKARIPVDKQWKQIGGKTFLIESVDYQSILGEVSKLPVRARAAAGKAAANVANVVKDRHVPSRIASAPNLNQKLQIAATAPEEKGFVLDYETSSGEMFFYTLRGGSTYYMSDWFYVDFGLTIEGGTVVKFAPEASLSVGAEGDTPGLICATAPYRPAVFTSQDDDSVGEQISGSSGSPSAMPDCSGLGYFDGDLHDARFSYIGHPLSCGSCSLENVQFLHCPQPLSVYSYLTAKNCLFYDFNTIVAEPYSWWGGAEVDMYNVTASTGNAIVDDSFWSAWAVNSIFSDVGDTSWVGGNVNGFYNASAFGDSPFTSANAPFQSVGGGKFYLAAPEFIGVGSADIPGDLMACLPNKTTQPPTVLTDAIGDATVFTPQVARDTSASPDLGMHYDPLDYLVGGIDVLSDVSLTNGVVIGFYPGGSSAALNIQTGVTFTSGGSPLSPNRLVSYDTVQEAPSSEWDATARIDLFGVGSSSGTSLNCRFTECSRLAGPGAFVGSSSSFENVRLKDCELYGGSFYVGAPAASIALNNCLFAGCDVPFGASADQTAPIRSINCSFHQNNVTLAGDTTPIAFTNCFFDTMSITKVGDPVLVAGYNAYLWFDPDSIIPPDSHDVVLAMQPEWYDNGPSYPYDSGALGYFYQPANSSLLNAGSQAATVFGLSHYTVLADQTQEGMNPVSIGYHYVALDGSNNAIDSDADGVADYIEDPNGNMFGTPPAITAQPVSVTVYVGDTATFNVTSIGTLPCSYQWQLNGTDISDATNASLSIINAQLSSAGNYSIIVTNVYGSATSDTATLTVSQAPQITADPTSQTVNAGQTATFTVTATGTGPLSYQWQLNGINITGATSSTFAKNNVQSSDAGNYRVVVANSLGSTTSAAATLTVNIAPSITTQPSSRTVNPGSSVTFSVTATGTAPLSYQWRKNGTIIVGATLSSYSMSNVQQADAGNYTVVVSNVAGAITSSTATLLVNIPPAISTQPASQTVVQYQSTNFTVVASGTSPLSYQWQFNGTNIVTATTSSLSKTNVQGSDAGNYTVVVTNIAGSVTSSPATLTVHLVLTVTNQPASLSVIPGANATFTVGVVGDAPIGYQWEFNGTNIIWATNISTLTITNVQWTNSGTYEVLIVDAEDNLIESQPATLTVAPLITSPPASSTLNPGSTATFAVTAVGTTNLSYQWQFNGGAISGATNSTYTNANVQSANTGSYTIVVSNAAGSTNATATLFVNIPPSIGAQPQNQQVNQGSNATFSVTASGTPAPTYQWRLNGSPLSWGTSSTITVTNVQSSNVGSYTVVVANVAGSVTSSTATLTTNVPPSITTQPQNQQVNQGSNATFSVVSSGTPTLSYQWWFSGVTNGIVGTNSTLTIVNVLSANIGSYWVVVTNVAGSTTSSVVTLTTNIPPSIDTQPQNQQVNKGSNATFSVSASGTPPLSYKWRLNGTSISWATTSTITVTNVQSSNMGSYTVVITNVAGSVTSSAATLTTNTPPSVVSQNAGYVIGAGTTVVFGVTVSGTTPYTYQWRLNGVKIGASTTASLTTSSYTVTNSQIADEGSYTCLITNMAGSTSSAPATLTIEKPAVITNAPVSKTAIQGQTVTFTVGASGVPAPSYQWQFNSINLNSATNSALSITNVQLTNAGSYTVIVSNFFGAVSNNPPATLTVYAPPSVTVQPPSQSVNPGSNATFTASATGTSPFYYQWQFNGTTIVGATNSTFTITNAQTPNVGTYSVTVGNAYGLGTSSGTLTVYTPPVISALPASVQVNQGTAVSFCVGASANPAPVYQWQLNGTNIGAATASCYSLPWTAVFATNTGTYTVIVSNMLGSTNASATLTLNQAPDVWTNRSPPQTKNMGDTATFYVNATGTAPITYQWVFNGFSGTPIPGATNSTLTITNVQISNSGTYYCSVQNLAGGTGAICPLTVIAPPLIQTPPANQVTVAGLPVMFSVSATGTAPLAYQWRKNGTNVVGATTTAYSITSAQISDAASYTVVVTNLAGTNSATATLSVLTSEPDCSTNASSLLAYWSFDSTNNPWTGNRGQLPVVSAGVQQVSGHSTNALAFTGFWPDLNYRYIDTDGLLNINCTKGAIAFWYNPNTNDIYAHQSESLVQIGDKYDCTAGWWSFGLGSSGTAVTFQTSSNGVQTTYLSTTMNWNRTNWYHFVLNYSPTSTSLYTNGVLAATGPGLTNYPSLLSRQLYGLTIGPSDRYNCCEAPGVIDELKTFNCPLGTNDVQNVYSGQ
jgi:hypothetical protein